MTIFERIGAAVPAIAVTATAWLLPVLLATWFLLGLQAWGYAGSIMRIAALLRRCGRMAERGWTSIIRALETHAADANERHTKRWMQEMAE